MSQLCIAPGKVFAFLIKETVLASMSFAFLNSSLSSVWNTDEMSSNLEALL